MYTFKKLFYKLFTKSFKSYKNYSQLRGVNFRGKSIIGLDDEKKIYKYNEPYTYVIKEDKSLENLNETEAAITTIMTEAQEVKHLPIPEVDLGSYKTVLVHNTEQLLEAIKSDKVILYLTKHISISEPLVIENKHICINGQTNSLYASNNIYKSGDIYKGTLNGENTFVTNSNTIQRLCKSKYYDALSQVETEEGVAVSKDIKAKGIYRIKVPKEVQDVPIDNTFIDFSCGWTAYTVPVIKIEGEYLYFNYIQTKPNEGLYSPNGDYNSATCPKTFTRFSLINCHKYSIIEQPGIEILNNTIIVNSDQTFYELEPYVIKAKNSEIQLENITFYNPILVEDSNCVLKSVNIQGCADHAICTYTKEEWSKKSTSQIFITTSRISNCLRAAIFTGVDSLCVAKDNSINNVNLGRHNYGAITCRGSYDIYQNTILDFGYCGIMVGKINANYPFYNSIESVQGNLLMFSEDYKYEDNVVLDSGAIYVGANNNNSVIYKNIIMNYNGRGYNNGIYCDDGCYHIKVINNIVQGELSGYAISARYAYLEQRGYSAGIDNTDKLVQYNYIQGDILMGGNKEIPNNNCVLGVNYINVKKKPHNVSVNSTLSWKEDQIYTFYSSYIAEMLEWTTTIA